MSKLTDNAEFKKALAGADRSRELQGEFERVRATRLDRIIDIARSQVNPKLAIQVAYANFLEDAIRRPRNIVNRKLVGSVTLELPEDLKANLARQRLSDHERYKIEDKFPDVSIISVFAKASNGEVWHYHEESRSKVDVTSEGITISYPYQLKYAVPYMDIVDGKLERIAPRPIFEEVENELGIYVEPKADSLNGLPKVTKADIDKALENGRHTAAPYESITRAIQLDFVLKEPHMSKDPELDLSDLNDNQQSL